MCSNLSRMFNLSLTTRKSRKLEFKIITFKNTKRVNYYIPYEADQTWEDVLLKLLEKLCVPPQAAVLFGLLEKKTFLPLWKKTSENIINANKEIRLGWRLNPNVFSSSNDYDNFSCFIRCIGINGFKLLLEEILYVFKHNKNLDLFEQHYFDLFHLLIIAENLGKHNPHSDDDSYMNTFKESLLFKVTEFLNTYCVKDRLFLKKILSDKCKSSMDQMTSPYLNKKAWSVFLEIIHLCAEFKNRDSFASTTKNGLNCGANGVTRNECQIVSWHQTHRWEWQSDSSEIVVHILGISDKTRICLASKYEACQFFEDIRAYGQLYHWSHFDCRVDGVSVELKCSENQRRWNFIVNANGHFDTNLVKQNYQFAMVQSISPFSLGTDSSNSTDSTTDNSRKDSKSSQSSTNEDGCHSSLCSNEISVSQNKYKLVYMISDQIHSTSVVLNTDGSLSPIEKSSSIVPEQTLDSWEIKDVLHKLKPVHPWKQVIPENYFGFLIGNSVNAYSLSEFEILDKFKFHNMNFSTGVAAYWESHGRYVFLRSQSADYEEGFSIKDRLVSTFTKTQHWFHPGICEVYGLILSPTIYLVSQLGTCQSLHTFLTTRTIDITADFVIQIAEDTGRALQYLHDFQFCCHGNITLNNLIMINRSDGHWYTKLSDPGCGTIGLKKDNFYNKISDKAKASSPKYLDLSYLSTSLLAIGLYKCRSNNNNQTCGDAAGQGLDDSHLNSINSMPCTLKNFLIQYRACNAAENGVRSPAGVFLDRLQSIKSRLTEQEHSMLVIQTSRGTEIMPPNLGLVFLKIPPHLILYELSSLHIDRNTKLGSGHYGTVYKGKLQHDNFEQPVAVKIFHSNEKQFNEFCEVQIQAGCSHRNIIQIIKYSIPNRQIIMELADCSLVTYFKKRGRKLGEKTFTFLTQICEGLRYLSNKSIVHRDIACRNILVVKDETVKIGDFGLARLLNRNESSYLAVTNPDINIYWLPPNDVTDREYNAQTDIWSFGVVFWEFFHETDPPQEYKKFNVYDLKTYKEYINSNGRLSFSKSIKHYEEYDKFTAKCWKTDCRERYLSFCEILDKIKLMRAEIIESSTND